MGKGLLFRKVANLDKDHSRLQHKKKSNQLHLSNLFGKGKI